MIYKIDHFYSLNHDKYCLMIESDIEPVKMAEILASIQFKFEDMIDESINTEEEHILKILIDFFGVKDVKKYYERFLPQMQLEDSEWTTINEFVFVDDSMDAKLTIVQIDLYEAREASCGPNYKDLINKNLPKDQRLDDYINSLKDYYLDTFSIPK